MKTKINGKAWTIEKVNTRQMKKEHPNGEHFGGLCIPSKRKILIADDCVDYQTVAHELFHAYWASLYLDDTNEVKLADIEEIAASMFADKAEEIVRQAKRVLKRLEKGK